VNEITARAAKIELLRRMILSLEGDVKRSQLRQQALWEWTRLSCSKWLG